MQTKKWLTMCGGLALAGLMMQADVSYAQQGAGRRGGGCPYYGAGSQTGGSGQYQNQQGRGPGSANCPNYQQGRVCDGTGPKGRGAGPRGKQGTPGSGPSGSGQQQ